MPGRAMSKVYFARPVTLSGPSSRMIDVPINVGDEGQAYVFAASAGTG